MIHILETVTIDGVLSLVSSNVMNYNVLSDVRACISVWFANAVVLDQNFTMCFDDHNSPNVRGSRWGSVTWVLVIV
jgi:hypothetical protein